MSAHEKEHMSSCYEHVRLPDDPSITVGVMVALVPSTGMGDAGWPMWEQEEQKLEGMVRQKVVQAGSEGCWAHVGRLMRALREGSAGAPLFVAPGHSKQRSHELMLRLKIESNHKLL